MRGERGFTLLEMVIAIALLTVVTGSLFGLVVSMQNDYVRQRDINNSHETLRAAESAITRTLRTSRADPFETGSALLDPDPDGDGVFDDLRVVSDYNPADGDFADALEDVEFWLDADTLKVRWQAGESPVTLTHPVEELALDYYDSAGNALGTPSQVVDATRVRVTLATDRGARSTSLDRIESWVYLRN